MQNPGPMTAVIFTHYTLYICPCGCRLTGAGRTDYVRDWLKLHLTHTDRSAVVRFADTESR